MFPGSQQETELTPPSLLAIVLQPGASKETPVMTTTLLDLLVAETKRRGPGEDAGPKVVVLVKNP